MFSDNFWESIDKNGISTLMERMKGSKQTCEKLKNAYEARAFLEEYYGKTLMQIYQKQKISHTENGSSKLAMEAMQHEMISIAESHIQLSQLIRTSVATPLSTLLNKQKTIKKELQTSIQKLHNNRQYCIHALQKAHKRHNFEIEKANLLVQQQSDDDEKLNTFQTAKITIDKLKKEYDQALLDLDKVVDEWNKEWKNTCQSFENLEKERLEFLKTNLSNYAQLMIGCLEGELKNCEQIHSKTENIDSTQDLVDFVNENKTSQTMPTSMDYFKLAALYETSGGKNDKKHDNEEPKQDPVALNTVQDDKKESLPVLMMGVMEVYPSDEEESDSDEYMYVTESENEEPEAEIEQKLGNEESELQDDAPKVEGKFNGNDANMLRTAYNQEIQDRTTRRASVIGNEHSVEPDMKHLSTLMDRYRRSVALIKPEDDPHSQSSLELDDMLQDLYSKRTQRKEPISKLTSSVSSPSPSEPHYKKTHQQKSNQFESTGRKGLATAFYDPFNSLSSSRRQPTRQSSPPSAQTMYDRMISRHSMSTSPSPPSLTGSVRSHQDKFVEDFYSIGSKSQSTLSTVSSEKESHFIDFALAQYDYEASDKGEIGLKEGDLLGILSKGDDGGEGWWEASVLNPKTQKIVRTGLVPSNFLETISNK